MMVSVNVWIPHCAVLIQVVMKHTKAVAVIEKKMKDLL